MRRNARAATPAAPQPRTPAAPLTHAPAADEFTDGFDDAQPAGHVVGSRAAAGVVRKGVDREGVLAIDHHALRISPLATPGWGRAGLSYGPYQRRNGLAFAVYMLNGHNTSQSAPLPDTVRERLRRWMLGSETERPLTRIARWVRSPQRRYVWNHLHQWVVTGSRRRPPEELRDNLALGWFPSEAPDRAPGEGNAMVMHALDAECGGLRTRVRGRTLPAVHGVQNVPIYYVVVLRERGAAYYAASVPGAAGLSALPAMTPLAIDPVSVDASVYAGIHQSVLGEIGFRVDSRVYRTQVATVPAYAQWYGSAAAADRLTGAGRLGGSLPDVGPAWVAPAGAFERSPQGARGMDRTNIAALRLAEPAGLVHALVSPGPAPHAVAALFFRVHDRRNYWAFELSAGGCALVACVDGVRDVVATPASGRLAPGALTSVQVFDDGREIRVSVDGDLAHREPSDARLSDGTGVAIGCSAAGVVFRDVEAHPRQVEIPFPLAVPEPWSPGGRRLVAADRFVGPPGDLDGRVTPHGARAWRREIGCGEILVMGSRPGAAVRATVAEPCPSRTAYTIPWDSPMFADVSVRITSPGTDTSEGDKGRGGVILLQDERNYITVSLWNTHAFGMSISAFFYREGYEELYDAVWTNIGRRVGWGVPFDFRVVFDATQFTASIDGEPVLYRALRDVYPEWERLLISRVGIVANWEWGFDTGSTFEAFAARDLPHPPGPDRSESPISRQPAT